MFSNDISLLAPYKGAAKLLSRESRIFLKHQCSTCLTRELTLKGTAHAMTIGMLCPSSSTELSLFLKKMVVPSSRVVNIKCPSPATFSRKSSIYCALDPLDSFEHGSMPPNPLFSSLKDDYQLTSGTSYDIGKHHLILHPEFFFVRCLKSLSTKDQ